MPAHGRKVLDLRAVLTLLVLAPALRSQTDYPLFLNPQVEAATATHLALGDIDGDGALDMLAAAEQNSDEVQAFLNTGYGLLIRSHVFEVSQSVVDVHLGDIDGDGHADQIVLVDGSVAVGDDEELLVLPGNGDGGFGEIVRAVLIPGDPAAAALGDLNGDGWLDVVTAMALGDAVELLLNDGSGALLPPVEVPVGNRPLDVELGDVDADGMLDLLTADEQDQTVTLRLGDGTGAFGPATPLAIGAAPGEVRLFDLDLDGQLDLLTGQESEPDVAVLLATTPGSFSAPVHHAVFNPVTDLELGDLNSSGFADLVVGAEDGACLLFAQGGGKFRPAEPIDDNALAAYELEIADLDLDGHLDVAFTTWIDHLVIVLHGDGQGGFEKHASLDPAGGILEMVAADIDADGDADLVTHTVNAGNFVVVMEGDGAGGFSTGAEISLEGVGAPRVGDLDHDGYLDIVVPKASDDEIAVLFGDGLGGFTTTLFAAGNQPGVAVLGDLDEDGVTDVVVGTGWSFSLRVLLNDGFGVLTQENWYLFPNAFQVELEDFDEDGHLDVVAMSSFSPGAAETAVFLGDGAGGLSQLPAFPTHNSRTLAVADLDEDGHVDVVLGLEYSPDAVRVRYGDGLGGLSEPSDFEVLHGVDEVLTGDVDADGHVDIVASPQASNGIAILHGTGTRDLAAVRRYRQQQNHSVALADVDGDGRLDVLAGASLTVMLQRAPVPWEDLGAGLAGDGGVTKLVGQGSLQPDADLSLTLSHAPVGTMAWFVAGTAPLNAPFKGGVLVPDPTSAGVTLPIPTGPTGSFVIEGPWPTAATAGFSAWFQSWIVDATGPAGFSASNAIRGSTPGR